VATPSRRGRAGIEEPGTHRPKIIPRDYAIDDARHRVIPAGRSGRPIAPAPSDFPASREKSILGPRSASKRLVLSATSVRFRDAQQGIWCGKKPAGREMAADFWRSRLVPCACLAFAILNIALVRIYGQRGSPASGHASVRRGLRLRACERPRADTRSLTPIRRAALLPL